MKHLTTLLTALVAFAAAAQQMPYNPDANGDDFVGVDDVLGVLGVYDTALMQPDLTCDYEGTSLEQLFGGLITQSLVLDSVYIEYYFVDSVVSFNPECPDPVVEEVVLQRSYMLLPSNSYTSIGVSYIEAGAHYLQYWREFFVQYNSENGQYELRLYDAEIEEHTSYSPYSYTIPYNLSLPFPSDFVLDADGIQCTHGSWAGASESLKILPFWHEAE